MLPARPVASTAPGACSAIIARIRRRAPRPRRHPAPVDAAAVAWRSASSESWDATRPRSPRAPSQVPPDQGRQGARRRQCPRQCAVDDHDEDHRHQRDAAADRRADGIRLRDRAGRRAVAGRRGCAAHHRGEEPDPGDRRHSLPAEVRVPGDRCRLRCGPGESGQHPQVRRSGRGHREGRASRRCVAAHRRERRVARPATAGEVRQGDPGGARGERRVGGLAVRGARLPRLQDLGQAQRPCRHGQGLPSARGAGRLARCTSA
ncbi:hypothetical protein QF046_000811 [Microbacterium sp. W4I4]|nr:hypothetical protein [Microbacterium sp. W4I4]